MGAFIAKQPNGLYCRFSTIVDTLTHHNMTEDDYIEMCAEKARQEAKDVLESFLRPFEWVENGFVANNMTMEEFKEILEECKVIK